MSINFRYASSCENERKTFGLFFTLFHVFFFCEFFSSFSLSDLFEDLKFFVDLNVNFHFIWENT